MCVYAKMLFKAYLLSRYCGYFVLRSNTISVRNISNLRRNDCGSDDYGHLISFLFSVVRFCLSNVNKCCIYVNAQTQYINCKKREPMKLQTQFLGELSSFIKTIFFYCTFTSINYFISFGRFGRFCRIFF